MIRLVLLDFFSFEKCRINKHFNRIWTERIDSWLEEAVDIFEKALSDLCESRVSNICIVFGIN